MGGRGQRFVVVVFVGRGLLVAGGKEEADGSLEVPVRGAKCVLCLSNQSVRRSRHKKQDEEAYHGGTRASDRGELRDLLVVGTGLRHFVCSVLFLKRSEGGE